jgi:hypothetical protein
MFLQIIVAGVALRQKSAGREKDHPLPCDFFQVLNEFQPVPFIKVFNNIKRHTGIKLAGLKMFRKFADVALHELVVRMLPSGLRARRRVAFRTDGVLDSKLLHRGRNAAARIQNTFAAKQRVAQSEFYQDLVGIVSRFQQSDGETNRISHNHDL